MSKADAIRWAFRGALVVLDTTWSSATLTARAPIRYSDCLLVLEVWLDHEPGYALAFAGGRLHADDYQVGTGTLPQLSLRQVELAYTDKLREAWATSCLP